MIKKMRFIVSILLVGLMLLNAGCSLFKKKNNDVQTQQAAQQAEDNSYKKSISDFISKIYSKPLTYYENFNTSGTIPDELKENISTETLELSNGNPDNRINLPRPVIINSLLLGNYEVIMDKQSGADTPEINSQFVGKSGDISTYISTVNLKAKCIDINDLLDITKASMDPKTAANVVKAINSGDFSVLSNAVMKVLQDTAFTEMVKPVDSTNKLDYIKVLFSYDVEVKKEGGAEKIVSFQESEKVKGFNNRLSLFNNIPVTRLPYLDTTRQDDSVTYSKESALITDFFNKLCSSLDNEKMELMAMYWNTDQQKFTDYLGKIGSASDSKSKSLVDMMFIGGDYKTKFGFDSFPILTNMEKISGGLSGMAITMHPAYSEKRKEYIVTFQAPVQKINGSVEGYTTTCSYDYSITLTGKDDTLKVSSISLNEHYYMN